MQDSRPEPVRTGTEVESLKKAYLDNLYYIQGRFPEVATPNDNYQALAFTIRDRLLHLWITTAKTYKDTQARTVCYLSAEYLLGPNLGNNLLNLGITDNARIAMQELGLDLDELLEEEEEPGLGNGGLGRLAACFMDSMAALQVPAIGYGIRYEFGLFTQQIRDGWQVEVSDKWLRKGNPWEIPRPEITYSVMLGGHTEHFTDENGNLRVVWKPARRVKGVAHDTPIIGYRTNNANLLRLWSAEAPKSFDLKAFNTGDYYRAVDEKVISENLTKVLYPNDEPAGGRELRLEQQYFLAACSLQDMIRIFRQMDDRLDRFHEKYVIQLNDTHPSIAIVELMRILVDEYTIDWDTAWRVTSSSFAYTNHTLLPEALEKWPVHLFEKILPRHLEIIYEINRRFLDDVRQHFPADDGILSRLSLIEESDERYVRMAHLACAGSFAINGVATLHTQLLRESMLHDFFRITPEKFSNKTNGVTPRRFLVLNNPGLCRLLCDVLGSDSWIRNLEELRRLETFIDDSALRERWRAVKQTNKQSLARFLKRQGAAVVDPNTLFDIHVKRIHEYKRQHLKVLHIITLYNRLKQDPGLELVPRTVIFGGKAAPSYYIARLIIKLINSVAECIDSDPDMNGRLKIVFVPDYNVKNSRCIHPAADLSEQISMAGKEASGTGNMKFAMNGALTIGTLDGANIEIREEVGVENFFLFGNTAAEVAQEQATGYQPLGYYRDNEQLQAAIDLIASGHFSGGDKALFRPLVDALLNSDEYMLCADFQSYLEAQDAVELTWRNTDLWTQMSILNVARIGRFSSDRAVMEYCEDIWRVSPLPIKI